MLASAIISTVAGKCQDTSFSSDDILALINECRGIIADDFDLPALRTSATVTALSTANSVALPVNYHKGLFWVGSANQGKRIGERKEDYHNLYTLLEKYPALDTVGLIECAVVDGSSLFYQGQDDDTLTLRFYQWVDDITTDEEPSEIPANLQVPILVNYCLREIFDDIEDAEEGPKKNTLHYDSRYQVARARLAAYIAESTPREPKHIRKVT